MTFSCGQTSVFLALRGAHVAPAASDAAERPSSGERRAACVLTARTSREFADAVRAAERDVVEQLRGASAEVFSDFRDEYDAMFESACEDDRDDYEGGNERGATVRMECASAPHVPAASSSASSSTSAAPFDAEASPEFVVVTPGRVSVLWSVSPVDAAIAPARGFRAPMAIRATSAIGLAKRLRRRLDDAISRLQDEDADVADVEAAEAAVRELAIAPSGSPAPRTAPSRRRAPPAPAPAAPAEKAAKRERKRRAAR